jgi:hypothetical protein
MLCCSTIGLTLLRLADVQQPKMTSTFSVSIKRVASRANASQSDRPSAITYSAR